MTKTATSPPTLSPSVPSGKGTRPQRLSVRITRFFSVILFLVLVGTIALIAITSLRGLQAETLARQQIVAAGAAERISSFLKQRQTELNTLALANDANLTEMTRGLALLLDADPSFQEIILVDSRGSFIGGASRESDILQNLFTLRQSQWFRATMAGEAFLSTLQISSRNEPYAIFALPILRENEIIGVIAARLDMNTLWNVVRNIPVGQTGQAYIVDEHGALIAHGDPNLVLQGVNLANNENLAAILQAPVGSSAVFPGFLGERVYGATANPAGTNFLVVTELPAREAEAPIRQSAVPLLLLITASLLGTLLAGRLAINRLVTKPVSALVSAANQFGQGNYASRAEVHSADELGLLGDTFNLMANNLQDSLTTLEERVAQRTRDLALTMGISRRLSSILDLQELIATVAHEIKEAFRFYQVHIYLLDDDQQELLLTGGAGAGEDMVLAGGRRRMRRLKVGEGVVGFAAENNTAVFIPNVTQDNRWAFNPALPATAAEIALPIVSGNQVLGVLDVQHNVAGELNEKTVELLQSIASQVAIGLQNARQLAETEANRKRLDLVVAGANDGIWDWEIPSNKTYFSPRWKAILGYEDHELPSDQAEFTRRLHPADRERMTRAMADYLAGKKNTYEHEFRLRHKDGTYRWILARAVLERDETGHPLRIVGSHSDITDRKQAEMTVQKQAAQLQAVTEINTLALSMPSNAEMLPIVTTQIRDRFGLYHAHIYLLDDDDTLRLVAGAGDAGRQMVQEGREIPLQQKRSLVANAARTAQPVLVNDVATSPDHLPHPLLPLTKAELAVPLLVESRVLGVLDVQADQTGFFSETDISIQTTLANQLAASIQTIRALEETAAAIARANTLTRRLLRTGWQQFAAKSGQRLAYSYERQKITNLLETPNKDITAGATLVQLLEIQGEPVGALAITEPRELTSEAREIAAAVAERLSEHLEALRLTQQTEEALAQTESLYQGSAMIGKSASPAEVLAAVISATAMQRMEQAAIVFFDRPWDENPVELTVKAAWSQPGVPVTMPAGSTSSLVHFPIMHLINHREPTIIANVAQDEKVSENLRNLFKALKINGLIGLPLTVGERWFGVLTAQSSHSISPLSEEEVRQIRSLVEQAATVLRTQQLLEEIQSRADLEQTLREITARVYAAPTAESVLRTAAREASRALGLETFAYVEETPSLPDTGPLGKNGKRS